MRDCAFMPSPPHSKFSMDAERLPPLCSMQKPINKGITANMQHNRLPKQERIFRFLALLHTN